MSTFFSKNRQKRPRSPSSEESDPSFVKNVTSRVSWLLPNVITKWFNSPRSSNANGSTPTADVTDSSTEDEMQDNVITAEPPLKRMRYRSPMRGNHFSSTSDTNNTVINADTIEPHTSYSTVRSPPGRTTFRRETNFVTPIQSLNEESIIQKAERDTTSSKSPHLGSLAGSMVTTKRKSIFGNDTPESSEAKIKAYARSKSSTMVDPKQPSFKPSLLRSPFYPGGTMYGGASYSYINQPNVKQRINIVLNEASSSENSTMSSSARRVLDLLEHYSSPLIDAKRIAPYLNKSSKDSPNTSLDSSSKTPKKVLSSYKTQELHVPSIASILRLKQKSRLMDSTNAARQIIASHSSTKDITPYKPMNIHGEETTATSNANVKLTTKVKSRLTRPKRRDNANLESDILEPVNLPSAVLHIDNMDNFSFGSTIISNTSTNTSQKPAFLLATSSSSLVRSETTTTKISEATISKPETVSNNILYKFSSPIRISTDSPQNIQWRKFAFGSPNRSINKVKVNEKTDCKSSYVIGVQEQNETVMTTKFKDPSADEAPDTFFNFGVKHPTKDIEKLDKCSVCKLLDRQPHGDKCNNCEKTQDKSSTCIPVSASTSPSKWKCDDCWVYNDETDDKCVCCGAKNPKTCSGPVLSMIVSNVTNNNTDSEWKCDDCWIKNKSSVDKCAACGGAKSGAKQSTSITATDTTLTFKPPDNSLRNIIKTQTDRWECPSCLVRNEKDTSKCICCETEKPGTMKELHNKFNFGITSNTMFKFGIDLKAQEVNLAKQTEVNPTSEKSNVETNNNILPKTVTFAFSSAANKDLESKEDDIKESACEAPKVNFTFGIPKEVSGIQSITPILKNTTKKDDESFEIANDKKEKPQEVSKVDLTAPSHSPHSVSKPLGGLFSSPVIPQNTPDKQIPVPISFMSSNPNTEKNETSNSTLQIATTSEAIEPKNTFTFSAGAIKPAINLFGSRSSTTASTSISFASPAISTPATTATSVFQKNDITTSTVSLFQKNEPTTTSTVSLFQKSDTPTATTASLAAPSTMFSFGTNTQSPQTQPEKPNFNFTFGSNNNETTALFKPTFGATVKKDDSSAGNKFTLPAGNTLATSNTLSNTSSLGGGNGLPGNSIMGNTLGGNGLPSGTALASGSTRPVNNLVISSSIAPGNGFQPGSTVSATPSNGLFSSPAQKENVWSSTNNSSNNLFVSNATTSTLQKSPSFTFGLTTPFNSNNSAPVFGNKPQSTGNLFGMTNQNMNNQPSMFSSPVQSQPSANIFGTPQPSSNPAPSMGMFGTPSVGATPTFGTPNPSIPTFEAPSHTPATAPTFNFGASQTTGVFGFGQQPPQQSSGVYNFGASGGTPQVQFNMGSAPNTAGRRMRKAVRRNPQR